APLLLLQQAVPLLEAGRDAVDRLLDVVHLDAVTVAARGEECRLVQEIGQIRTDEAGRASRDEREVDGIAQLDVRGVHAQDRLTPYAVGPVDDDLSIEAPGSKQRRDRKSTRLNSSHVKISYAVFCLKKKTERYRRESRHT